MSNTMTQWDKWLSMWRYIGHAYKLHCDLHYNLQLRTAQFHDRFFQEARVRADLDPRDFELTFKGVPIQGFSEKELDKIQAKSKTK